jgi:glyoxylase I family protein
MGFDLQFIHASLITSNTPRSLHFYCDILGLDKVSERPDLGFPGAWLQLGNQQIHLLELSNPDPTEGRPQHGGRDRHLAFTITQISDLITKLDQHQIPYTMSKSGRRALFCRDPDQNALEFIEK